MTYNKSEESEILNSFFEKAAESRLLDRTAEYTMAEFDISAPAKDEFSDLVVVASSDNRLYGVTGESGEDLVHSAHPDGGKVLDLGSNDKTLSTVETVVERQKAMRGMVEKKPTGKLASAIEKLVALANILDERGDYKTASEIDRQIRKLAQGDTESPAESADVKPVAKSSAGDDARRKKVRELNARYMYLLNTLSHIKGGRKVAPNPESGILTPEVKSEMAELGVVGAKTWRQLFRDTKESMLVFVHDFLAQLPVAREARNRYMAFKKALLSTPDGAEFYQEYLPDFEAIEKKIGVTHDFSPQDSIDLRDDKPLTLDVVPSQSQPGGGVSTPGFKATPTRTSVNPNPSGLHPK